ncbi:MAG: hypothetical protein B0A82_02790 [Alkalinema sp. CACIAM 70d]|nr:hypothetical protein [Alkalinema sp. FACHB-956]MBD2329956.1 hypothetical protein [Alkalinema sp. FACHB-956]OUC16200.1 MAG: hypothetical protein B0A82_02790 [Alkalinema sp. CACIAM 70d]
METDVDNEAFELGIDPALVRSARVIYETFYTVHPEVTDLPLGVAINRFTHRGKLIFSGKPILLPQECFIPFELFDHPLGQYE